MNDISKRIEELVQAKQISTRQLEIMTGIPKSAIQRYISGATERIPIPRLKLIANALHVTPGYLMGIETIDGQAIDLKDDRSEQIEQILCIAKRLPPDKLEAARAVLQALADNL